MARYALIVHRLPAEPQFLIYDSNGEAEAAYEKLSKTYANEPPQHRAAFLGLISYTLENGRGIIDFYKDEGYTLENDING